MESRGKPLAGRSAVITGANQGLGRAIAEHLVRAAPACFSPRAAKSC